MKKIKLILFLLLLISNISLYSLKKEYNFSAERIGKDKYEIFFYFESTLDEKELIDICYDSNQINKYINPIIKVTDINSTESTQELNYNVKVLFYNSDTIYKRERNTDKNEIIFFMKDFNQNVEIIPDIVESNGYIKISTQDNKTKLYYYQDIKFIKDFSRQYFVFSKMQTETFCKNLYKYIKNIESEKIKESKNKNIFLMNNN